MSLLSDASSNLSFQGKRVAVLTAGLSSGEKGGAERFYAGLSEGLKSIGCDVELIAVPSDEPTFEDILSNYQKCKELNLSSYDFVISTKAPTYAINHQNHVVYLVHTVRVFDDMFDVAFDCKSDHHYAQRAQLHEMDFQALSAAKARFAIGNEVARRLYRWRGLSCEVLHPPLAFNDFHVGKAGNYFFLPGRLHPWKRIDLLIKAIKKSTLPMNLILAGVGEAQPYLKDLAGDDERIEFLGKIPDEQLVRLYADCLAVPFVPLREDYGYVTLEAFSSGKPVLTCKDSGEVSHFVRPYQTGLVVAPTPEHVRRGLEWLWTHREQTEAMGGQAKQLVSRMSWVETASALAEAALSPDRPVDERPLRVAVIDMQPIDPPIGGGRLRLLGLYHNLGRDITCTYLGTYDWPGEAYRSHKLSETLTEVDVPLSDAHHAAATTLSEKIKGKVVIDLAFSQQAHLSPKYINTAIEHISEADVVVFSHPWVYPLVKDHIRSGQTVIYDAQNVEGFLRAQFLDENNDIEGGILRQVVEDERDVGWAADWIICCSHEDMLRFNRVYGFPIEKMRVVPNGVMAFAEPTLTEDERRATRQALNIEDDDFLAIFIGSPYGPNVQAASFIVHQLAPAMPDVTFVIAGGVADGLSSSLPNVRLTGRISEQEKTQWLHAADIAVNPMEAGSGTNVKMFDFMGAGLPVVTTSIGARGIEVGGRHPMLVVAPTVEEFASAIGRLRDSQIRSNMGKVARQCVVDGYAWERISTQLGCFFKSRWHLAGQSKPLFSVVVPTYERHDQLDELFTNLQKQTERDFEVVVIDQSTERWPGSERSYGFPTTYFHTPVRGAVRARNTGAMLAQGSVIAFVDDDCRPLEDWLLNARSYFTDTDVIGVEGLITSDHLGDPNWRPVTNEGFEGIGFMTANLFVRSEAFHYLAGFDLLFDHPHFREDTDFGWRMLDLGKVPFAKDVTVFHPAQPRSKDRESSAERGRFFVKDALLYRKHPERYRQLFFAERHFDHTHGFRENLLTGFEGIEIAPPEWMKAVL